MKVVVNIYNRDDEPRMEEMREYFKQFRRVGWKPGDKLSYSGSDEGFWFVLKQPKKLLRNLASRKWKLSCIDDEVFELKDERRKSFALNSNYNGLCIIDVKGWRLIPLRKCMKPLDLYLAYYTSKWRREWT